MSTPINIELNTGALMPAVGLGTWHMAAEEFDAAVDAALRAGYRHFDTAYFYRTEQALGSALRRWLDAGQVNRDDLFVTTKLPPSGNHPDHVEEFLKLSLAALQLDYVDLFLIHVPAGLLYQGKEPLVVGDDGTVPLDLDTDLVALWQAMEAQVDAGRAKAIGVSNYNLEQLRRVLDAARIPPANLQIELHVHLQQPELVDFCKENNISVTAYSAFGSPGSRPLFDTFGCTVNELPDLLHDPTIEAIAKSHNKSTAQVMIRHALQRGLAVVPKSANPKRIKENFEVFDFELSEEDMAKLRDMDKGESGRFMFLTFVKGYADHPEYPWKIPTSA